MPLVARRAVGTITLTGGLLALLLIAVIGGCGNGRIVLPISIDPLAITPPRDGRDLRTDAAAVRGIAAILARELGLPVPSRFTVYFYDTAKSFERGLVQDGEVSPARAAELSDFAIGVGRRRQLLLNEEGIDPSRREWLRLIAHEMTHVCQIELAEGEGRAAQWLAEGMAEWVAFTVLERLHLDQMTNRREIARRGIRNHAALVSARLDLATLGTPRGFTVRHRREGSVPTYQLAFLMTDYIIEHHGFSRVVDYFRSFGTTQSARENFEQAFGTNLDDFEREILTHLKRSLQP
jgi:hypothetical protein